MHVMPPPELADDPAQLENMPPPPELADDPAQLENMPPPGASDDPAHLENMPPPEPAQLENMPPPPGASDDPALLDGLNRTYAPDVLEGIRRILRVSPRVPKADQAVSCHGMPRRPRASCTAAL